MSPQTYWCLLKKQWKRLVLLFKEGVGDSKEGATKESLDRTKGAPWHGLGRA